MSAKYDFSMSGAERAERCPPSVILPQSNTTSSHAAEGTVMHEYLANVNTRGPAIALELVPAEFQEAMSVIDLDGLPPMDQYAAEVSFAYNPATDTGRELGRGLDRNYADLQPGEIPGTMDLFGLADDAVVVLDHKRFGWGLGPARDNRQLRTYALAAARAFKRERAFVALIRTGEDGVPRWSSAELSMIDLDATAEVLRRTQERIAEARVQYENRHAGIANIPLETNQGDHCNHCPAFASCPAKMNLVREVALATGEPGSAIPVITKLNAPAVLERVEAMEKVVEYVRGVLRQYASSQPIHLPGGYVYGVKVQHKDALDPKIAATVLALRFDALLPDEAIETEPKLTKTGLGKALRKYMQRVPGLKITALQKAALDALREGGGVTIKKSFPITRFKPDELAAGDES